MEALGAAASVISVVSLALQLIETVQDLNDFFTSLEGAPEELCRLTDNLTHLKGVLQDVSSVAEMQRLQNDTPVLGSTMMAALKGCQKDIESLEAVLKKAQIGYGNRRRLVPKWNSLKFVAKTKDIKEFENRIDGSMQRLMLSMMANLSTISISSHGDIKVLLANSGPAAQHNSTATSFVSAPSTPNRKTSLCPRFKSRTVGQPFRYEWHDRLRYRRLELTSSTQELVSMNTENENQENTGFGRKKTISISMWFLHYFFRFQIEMRTGSWKHSFTVYQTILWDDPIWRFVEDGDIPSLQNLFTSGTCSPFVVDQWGCTLIHRATLFGKTETIMFLLQLGIDANLVNAFGNLPLTRASNLESCKALVECGQNDPMIAFCSDPIGLRTVVEPDYPPMTFWILTQEEFLIETKGLGHLLHDFAASFGNICNRYPFELISPDWSRLLLHLLRNGFNLTFSNCFGQTPLDTLFGVQFCQIESQFAGTQWLELLASSDIDLKKYIADEKTFHPDGLLTHPYNPFRRRYIFMEDPSGNQHVSWEWVISPESPAYMVLKEFIIICHSDLVLYDAHTHSACKNNIHWSCKWPFDSNFDDSLSVNELRQRRWNRQSERRERRRNHYKIPREYQPRRRRRNRMPGSWTEDKYQTYSPSNFSLPIPRWLILCIIGLAGQFLLHVYLTRQVRLVGDVFE